MGGVREREITSVASLEGVEWDPYAQLAAWKAQYRGMLSMTGEREFHLSISICKRKGFFKVDKCTEILGELCESKQEIRLNIYFAAGGCNQGTAGLKWVVLKE